MEKTINTIPTKKQYLAKQKELEKKYIEKIEQKILKQRQEYLDNLTDEEKYIIEQKKIYTENKRKIFRLKKQLSETDYKAIKYAEGYITEEAYAPIKAERESLRQQIRDLELLL